MTKFDDGKPHQICFVCFEYIDESKPYIALSVTKEVDDGDAITVLDDEPIGAYHIKCSPFRIGGKR